MPEPQEKSSQKRDEANARECTTTIEEREDEVTLTTTCRRPAPPMDEREPEEEGRE